MKVIRWHLLIIAAAAAVVVTNAAAYIQVEQPPIYLHGNHLERMPERRARLEPVSALARLAPEGEIIHVTTGGAGSSRVERVLVSENQQVRKGAPLAVLEGRQVDLAEVENAEQMLSAAEAKVVQLLAAPKQTIVAQEDATIARLRNDSDQARRDAHRYKDLYTDGAVSTEQYDAHLSAAASKQHAVEQEQAARQSLFEVRPADLAVAKSEVARAKAQLSIAKRRADLDVIRAPQNGCVLKVHTHEGEREKEAGLLEIGATSEMFAVAEVYESDVARVRIGAPVAICGDSFSGKLHGTVTSVAQEVSKQSIVDQEPSTDVDARIVETKIRFDARSSKIARRLSNARVHALIGVQP